MTGRNYYPCQQNWSVWVGRLLFVCVCIHGITQKQMITKCSNLAWGMILGYPGNVMAFGLKDQGHRVNKCIFHTTTALHWHSLGGVTNRSWLHAVFVWWHLTDNSNTAWVWTLWVPSSSIGFWKQINKKALSCNCSWDFCWYITCIGFSGCELKGFMYP